MATQAALRSLSEAYVIDSTGHILAQTWDMHATAIPYVMVLGIPESEDGPAARLLTVTGCLGMAGMNASRVSIAINNLYSTDATLGVVWPAMVRQSAPLASQRCQRNVKRRSFGPGSSQRPMCDETTAPGLRSPS